MTDAARELAEPAGYNRDLLNQAGQAALVARDPAFRLIGAARSWLARSASEAPRLP